MSLTKLSLGGNNLYMTPLFPPRESLVSDIPAGDGNIEKLFLWFAGVKQLIPTSTDDKVALSFPPTATTVEHISYEVDNTF